MGVRRGYAYIGLSRGCINGELYRGSSDVGAYAGMERKMGAAVLLRV